MSEKVSIKRALISVSDKAGVVGFVKRLADFGVQIFSTGGTAKVLADAGLDVVPVEQVTGSPEMLDGRVKTLHPKIHGALLGLRDNPSHVAAMAEHGIDPIDLVCVNLYPFEQTAARSNATSEDVIEQIDIGGPSMIRSAAKNHRHVAVVTDPSQYDAVCDDLEAYGGATTLELRERLAGEAYAKTAAYDAAISNWMAKRDRDVAASDELPVTLSLRLNRIATLRYGENPHQAAALYDMAGRDEPSVAHAQQMHGKELSYNNLNDAAAALELVKEFSQPAAVVVKHTNPCGCAVGLTLDAAFEKAYAGDPLAAFGGIVALNRQVDLKTSTTITQPGPDGKVKFLEVILAPGYDHEALAMLRERWKNVRLLSLGDLGDPGRRDRSQIDLKSIVGGVLVQQRDLAEMTPGPWRLVAGPQPDEQTMQSLHVAWCSVKHVKSNAITIARDAALIGAGAGQMDRVQSCWIAVSKANVDGQDRCAGAVAASDAFFPFTDGPTVLIDAGIKAIVQPGGSKRDQDTIDVCRDANVSLLMTGRRHFRH